MAELRDRGQLAYWLAAQPIEVAIALAARSALRVVPSLPPWRGLPEHDRWNAQRVLLSEMATLATAWAVAAYPAHRRRIFGHPHRRPGGEAGLQVLAAVEAQLSLPTDAANEATRDSVAFAVVASARAASAFAAEMADPAAVALRSGGVWQAVGVDVRWLEDRGITPENGMALMHLPLWSRGPPDWAARRWTVLRRAMLSAHPDWTVWTEWYEARLAGHPADERLEIARVGALAALWAEDPRRVNAEIRDLVARHTLVPREPQPDSDPAPPPAPPPQPPPDGPGPRLMATPDGFDTVLIGPGPRERDDPMQLSLHARVKARVARLAGPMERVQNTHKALHDEFVDYMGFVAPTVAEIDVPSLWSAGAALRDMVEALAPLDGSARRTLLEPLEPDVLALLRALLRVHTAFIMGFPEAEELERRARALALLDVPLAELARRARAVLAPMLRVPSLLTCRAKALVQMLDRALDQADERTVALVGAGVATATEGIVAFGRAVTPFVVVAATAAGVSGYTIKDLVGDPNAEALKAALSYLIQNGRTLLAFACHNPQLQAWLEWLIEEVRRSAPLGSREPDRRPRASAD